MVGSCRRWVGGLLVVGALVTPAALEAQDRGIQLSLDRVRVLVNKDVADERWAIALNTTDLTVLGNVFRPGGGEPVFIFCVPTGTANTFACQGAGPCTTELCTDQYTDLGVVTLPADFFLPEGVDLDLATAAAPRATTADPQGADRGFQETPNGMHALVSKDVGNERWAITLNRDDRTVTGNVFFPEGGDPAFLSCSQVIGHSRSFDCFGAGPCVDSSCEDQYTPLGLVTLPVDFFGPTTCGDAQVRGHERCEAGAFCVFLCSVDDVCQPPLDMSPIPIPGSCSDDCNLCEPLL